MFAFYYHICNVIRFKFIRIYNKHVMIIYYVGTLTQHLYLLFHLPKQPS